MKTINYILFVSFIFTTSLVKGQTALQIGDKVPQSYLQALEKAPRKTEAIGPLNGKLVIIDYFSTNCGGCVEELPRMDSLQQKYGNAIRIILVCSDTKTDVDFFLKHNRIGSHLHLPLIYENTQLKKYFPFKYISHVAWITDKKIVEATTYPEYVKENIIAALLRHQPVNMPIKNDIAYDYSVPLESNSMAAFYSLITPYKPGVLGRMGSYRDSLRHTTRFYSINQSILSLYKIACRWSILKPANLTIITATDSDRIRLPQNVFKEGWNRTNAWCYESVLPDNLSVEQKSDLLRQDLNKFFNLDGRVEKHNVKCLVLIRTDTSSQPVKEDQLIPFNNLHRKDTLKAMYAPPSELVWEMNDIPGGLPAIDESGYKENIHMVLPVSSFANVAALNQALAKYGFKFDLVTRALDLMVITEGKKL